MVATMVATGTKNALQCRNLVPAWREWRQTQANQHTWQQWKLHWNYAFNYQRDIQKLANGGGFYLQSNSATETRMGEKIGDSLNNIANAAVQNNDTVGKLVIANNNLTDSIVSLQAHNLKLSKLAEKLTAGTPEVANLSKYDKLPWDPTN